MYLLAAAFATFAAAAAAVTPRQQCNTFSNRMWDGNSKKDSRDDEQWRCSN